MDIVLIGSGNVATVLGRKSRDAGHRIIQVYSQTPAHARSLAAELGTTAVVDVSDIKKTADLTIIALRDDAVATFVGQWRGNRSILTHTAGALSMVSLQSASKSFGVLYPLQSLRKEIPTIPPLSLLVDASDSQTKSILKQFASSIAETVLEANDAVRLKYHLAATLVNNFTNYLYVTAASFCKQENISFQVLQPLIEETAHRLRYVSASASQTGPAWRNDQITLEKHRQVLKEYPALAKLYELFTEEIQRFALSANGG
jgi:predicted short-subunit dehydrogenase-like oxidoreductase (DUF2520 family)